MHEDKQMICNLLKKTLQATDNASDLCDLVYHKVDNDEIVIVIFAGGTRSVNVTMDSGTAMIRDIMANLGC